MSTRFLVLFMILVNAHLVLALATHKEEEPAAVITVARKIGKHVTEPEPVRAEPPQPEENSRQVSAGSGDQENGPSSAEEEVMRSDHRNHHRSVDKSVAGGGVILGGLATTFLVAVFCYIRATGRRKAEQPGSPINSDASAGSRKTGESVNLSN